MTDDALFASVRALNPVPAGTDRAAAAGDDAALGRILATPRLVPAAGAAGLRGRWRGLRRLAFAAAALIAVGVPLGALAAAQDWWSLRLQHAPKRISEIHLVRSGTWDSKAWQLHAYLSSTDGVCFSVGQPPTPEGESEGGMACDRIEGVPATAESKPYTPHGITYLASFGASHSGSLPSHVAGPVVETAESVEIHLGNGQVVRTETFDAPDELGAIRFYAAQLPEIVESMRHGRSARAVPRLPVTKLVGLNGAGQVVACMVVPMPEPGAPLPGCS